MKKAGAIVRVSTTKQLEGTSPEKQLEAILALAETQGYQVEEKNIWELAESGSSRSRIPPRVQRYKPGSLVLE